MDTSLLLRARASDLGLREDEIGDVDGRLDERFLQALLANLVKFEEALEELSG